MQVWLQSLKELYNRKTLPDVEPGLESMGIYRLENCNLRVRILVQTGSDTRTTILILSKH